MSSTDNITVHISGPVLSMLLLESARNNGNAQGLLFGHCQQVTNTKITDENNVETFSLHLNINDYSKTNLRYAVNQKETTKNCVGIYNCRKLALRPSLIEKTIHQRIIHQRTYNKSPLPVVTLLITCQTLQDGRYRWNFTGFCIKNKNFESVKINISNLGECSTGLYTAMPQLGHSGKVDKILKDLSLSMTNSKLLSFQFVNDTRFATEKIMNELDLGLSQLHSTQSAINIAKMEQETLSHKIKTLKAKRSVLKSLHLHKRPVENADDDLLMQIDSEVSIPWAETNLFPDSSESQDNQPGSSTQENKTQSLAHHFPVQHHLSPSEQDENTTTVKTNITKIPEKDLFASLVVSAKESVKVENQVPDLPS